jgi:hypothetical protein
VLDWFSSLDTDDDATLFELLLLLETGVRSRLDAPEAR